MSEPIGTFDEQAVRDERTAERKTYRDICGERGLATTSGQMSLGVPRLKGMRFATAIIERCKRRETSVEEAMIEMHLVGVSTRRIENVSETRERVGGHRIEP